MGKQVFEFFIYTLLKWSIEKVKISEGEEDIDLFFQKQFTFSFTYVILYVFQADFLKRLDLILSERELNSIIYEF